MDIYLVCADSPCRYALKGANIMDLYLAESSGIYKAYFRPVIKRERDEYIHCRY